ncbi:MAG: type II secretion system F family protein [Candidatus Micrarchaeia archaeon]
MESKIPILPFSLVPSQFLFVLAEKTRPIGNAVQAWMPILGDDLMGAGYGNLDADAYATACVLNAFTNFFVSFLFINLLGVLALTPMLLLAGLASAGIGVATLVTCLVYPQIVASQRRRAIDANMITATRQLLIQIRSGVPLFNALLSVSTGHNKVSDEFYKIVAQLNAGVAEADALAEASATSPSMQFRKVVWQLSNALKVGTDVGLALEATLSELEHEQTEQIKKYAQELSPLTMIYMISAIIVPSLGVTLLIVIGSLLSFPIPKALLVVIFIIMVGFQAFFLDFVSTRRPVV